MTSPAFSGWRAGKTYRIHSQTLEFLLGKFVDVRLIETGVLRWLYNSDIFCCSSYRGDDLHKAVDLVCNDYGIVNTPFSGSLAGPVSRKDPAGNQYDGVKLVSDGKEDKMLILHMKVSAARERNF